jgi:hypothetical protein
MGVMVIRKKGSRIPRVAVADNLIGCPDKNRPSVEAREENSTEQRRRIMMRESEPKPMLYTTAAIVPYPK